MRRLRQHALGEVGDRRVPLRMHVAPPANLIEIQRLQLFGDRSATTAADAAAVEFADGRTSAAVPVKNASSAM